MQAIWMIGVLVLGQVQPTPSGAQPRGCLGAPVEATQNLLTRDDVNSNASNSRFWFGADYLAGWIRGGQVPPLVTAGTGPTNPGVLGQPGTTVLFGDDRQGGGFRAGLKANLGGWFDCDHTCGIEARFFWLPSADTSGTFGGPGQPVVSRPFINGITGRPDAELVNLPGVVGGTASVNSQSGPFIGADLVFRQLLCCSCNYRIDGLIGYRFLYFRDQLDINENLMTTDPTVIPTNFRVNDSFTATNTFHGLDLGLTGSYWWKRVSMDFLGRVAFGDVHRDVQIDGSTLVAVQNQAPVLYQGGLLALSSNIGRHRSDDFAVVPEIGVGASYWFRPNLRARVAYSFIYWPNVARAGDQIDPVVNPNLIPPPIPGGPARPAFTGGTESLWVQTLSLGLEFTF